MLDPVKVELHPGHPLPLGATVRRSGVNFAIASRYATAVTLCIFTPDAEEAIIEFPLDARFHRTGEIWHAFLKGIDPGIAYEHGIDKSEIVHWKWPYQLLLRCNLWGG